MREPEGAEELSPPPSLGIIHYHTVPIHVQGHALVSIFSWSTGTSRPVFLFSCGQKPISKYKLSLVRTQLPYLPRDWVSCHCYQKVR